MKELPIIELERIVLRPFELSDAKSVQELAGDRSIAEMTLNIPHPYEDGIAEKWIKTHLKVLNENHIYTLAVTHREENYLIGSITLSIYEFDRAEIGYWVGKKYWNNGYCTEATLGLIRFGFEELNLNRIYGFHLAKNPASGKVMQKTGMKYEGLLRQHIKKWGEYEDLCCYGILREEFMDLLKEIRMFYRIVDYGRY